MSTFDIRGQRLNRGKVQSENGKRDKVWFVESRLRSTVCLLNTEMLVMKKPHIVLGKYTLLLKVHTTGYTTK